MCQKERARQKSSVYQFLVKKTTIYKSFKPRPECSMTKITHYSVNESYHMEVSPDPMGLSSGSTDCLNSFELVFIGTAVMMTFSFFLLFYHRKKVRFG